MRSPSPEAGPSRPPSKSKNKAKLNSATPRKPTLFDDLDIGTGTKRTAADGKALLEKLSASTDDESSLSSLSDDEFEDVPPAKRQKTGNDEDDEDEDEDMEFEDVETHHAPVTSAAPMPSGDLELTLTRETRVDITNPFGTKKGPSKIERGIRINTHQMHVQMLMFHNAIRNSWLCDKELQDILVEQLPTRIMNAVEKWRHASGLEPKKDDLQKGKGKGRAKVSNDKKSDPRKQRDWGEAAGVSADGEVADPLIKLLTSLAEYWRKMFRITAPGLRKLGYMSLQTLDEEIKSFKEDNYDPERHGERIRDIGEFKDCARSLEGSRDVGAQLWIGLLRGLGLEARLVASLQPVGFGWSAIEEAAEKNPRILKKPKAATNNELSSSDDSTSEDEEANSNLIKKGKPKVTMKSTPKAGPKPAKLSRTRGAKEAPINLSDSEEATATSKDDDESVIDVTSSKRPAKASLPYDKDLIYPHYWSEVLSPVTNTYIPVDAVRLNIVGKDRGLVEQFETRGSKSEKAKQVTAYIIAHSPDGTAKDVTTRYLKRQVWPGRTKGNRFPVEKIPIYNRHGKVKRYEQKDWFKTVMSGYVRGTKKCPRTEIDDHEEATDLKPVKAEKKVVEEGKETLQYYKSSPDFVLERHLKREEALVPNAQHVKMFSVKGAKGEEGTEEKVFRRKDVVSCKSTETWHKEGRAPKPGEAPLKRVPYRVATTNRRRELAEAEKASGEKVLQGLFSRAQTDWIIPPPIENGIIPKNQFGNIDLYVDSMLPVGAAHIPYRGTVKICKRLNVDYAEAVTGFEFGHRMAVPVITGVVVAAEHYDAIIDEWEKDEAERARKEDDKRKKAAIHMWRKMLMGMRIIERVREEYGDIAEGKIDDFNPWTNHKDGRDAEAQKRIMDQKDEDLAGGFLPEGFDADEPQQRPASFYPITHDDDEDDPGGGFVVEGYDQPVKSTSWHAYATPQSLQSKTKAVDDEELESDEGEQGTISEAEAPAPKKRGRPAASAKKTTNAKIPTLASTKGKGKISARLPAPAAKGRRKIQIHDSNESGDDDDEESSSLSDLESEAKSESEVEEPPKKARPKKRAAARRATLPAKVTENTARKTPKRKAARKSETALRSHYFEHDDDEDED